VSVAGKNRRIAVVGGGISGLSTAFRLDRAGHTVELIERADTLGGRFGVGKLGARDVMFGGKNIGRQYSSFREFTSAFGNPAYEPFGINASRLKDGQLYTVDSSRRGSSLRNLLRAGAPTDLLRLVRLALRIRSEESNRFLGSEFFTKLANRKDNAPLSAHFGPELTRYLLRPMTVRMNGAEPDEVYLGTFGTNLSLLMDTYDQLEEGIQPVLDAVAQRLDVRLDAQVEGLVLQDGRVTGLRVAEGDSPAVERHYDGVVLATPAQPAAEIVSATHPALGKRLREVRYFPSTVVLVEYDRPFFSPDVRALAMDDGPCSNAGAYGKEDRHIVRYTFSGRQGRTTGTPEQVDAWVDETEALVSRHLGIKPGARVRSLTRHWDAAYCAYLPFHGEFLSEVLGAAADTEGLELAGDYLKGASIEACSRSGAEAAARMSSHLARAS
jgi:protoporphyrinogen/coproporphyrinogen III oxidase